MNDVVHVGFIGLGNIGKPMARRLCAWPGGLTVFDIAAEPLDELAAAGATVADSVQALAAECGVISVMVNTDDQVNDVMEQVVGAARPGTVVAVHSTMSLDLPSRLKDLAVRHDLLFADAPVSGGAMGAEAGTLAILFGGGADAFAAVEGPFALMAGEVVHCGPVGKGTAFKLARNMLHFISYTATDEALRLAAAAGLDLQDLGRVVRHTDAITGGAGAIMHRDNARTMTEDDPWWEIFQLPLGLGAKDLANAVQMADQLGVDVPMARYAHENLGAALGYPTGYRSPDATQGDIG
jgi:3-hydroxyisobutyrate dehydrogenase-like beta-hydroxyacid dehydrogenase